ncbi:hypothetical protein C8A03DRAFT_35023 [Achaetomium macrosporum]|uniref:Uncharacterized protein n=1 Tax=Achaetomium macrosporum TaxID=79813 RepID=A0AAN7C7T0_9PEZI|nr:hypothetical protein C8A03DRAFT_35023 [Achaetomium macrosporum]
MVRSDSRRARQAGQSIGRSDPPSQQRRHDESWVEVSSQPSSSSLSSIGDDIVTTGLRVGSNAHPPRRRRWQQQHPMPASFIVGHPATQGGATSSQEEYDETESEEDRVMTSSTEAIHPSANLHRQHTTLRAAVVDVGSESDDDENATALGRPSNIPVFSPEPNAFSHPPSHLSHRHSTGSAPHYHHSHSRPFVRSRRGTQDFMSPSYQADNDAALRASLTTLLSCAAAARGLPKHEERRNVPGAGAGAGVVPSSQPMELRLVPESELMGDDSPPTAGPSAGPSSKAPHPPAAATRTASNSSSPSAPCSPPGRERESGRTKREATTQSRPARATKKKRTSATVLTEGETATATDADASPFFMSPTIFTWVVSAGVVVLVSVVGFGAGYVIGREVGRQESATAALAGFGSGGGVNASSAAAGCGSELARSGIHASGGTGTLRRFQWGGVGKSVTA